MIWLVPLSVQLATSLLAVPSPDGSLAQLQQICSGAPSFEEIESRSEALGWSKDPATADQYLSFLQQMSPADDQPEGQMLAMRSEAGDFILIIDDEWTGCVYRNPAATSMPSAEQWRTIFGIKDADIEDQFHTDEKAFVAFGMADGSGPSYAVFMHDAEMGVADQAVGLTIVYEYTKEADK